MSSTSQPDPEHIGGRPGRWFTIRSGRPLWRRKIVDMHTRVVGGSVIVEPVARYWSARRAAGLVRVLTVMQRNGGKL